MIRRLVVLALSFASAGFATTDVGQTFDTRARALDGDTVAVDFRLLSVDAFECGQLCERASGCWQCGQAAQDLAAKALRSRTSTIRLTPATTYGRPVAIVSVAGEDLGERMIRAGLVLPEPQYLRDDPARRSRCAAVLRWQSREGQGPLPAAGLPHPGGAVAIASVANVDVLRLRRWRARRHLILGHLSSARGASRRYATDRQSLHRSTSSIVTTGP